MNDEQMNRLLGDALYRIFFFDIMLLKRVPQEACMNHRLAVYFELLFGGIVNDEMYYSVDVEYDRNLEQKNKEIVNDNRQVLKIRPDIIIHKRKDNDDNLLAVEAKYRRLKPHDYLKLKKLLLPPYNYTYTAGVVYHPSRNYFEYVLFKLENGLPTHTTVRIPKAYKN